MATFQFDGNRADQLLKKASELFKERNAVYGDNYLRVGKMMEGLFPEGVTISGEDDFNRFHILMLIIVKLSRYGVNWKEGHQDSIEDMTVYCAMLDMIDRNIKASKELPE